MERIEDVDVVGGMHQRCGQEGKGSLSRAEAVTHTALAFFAGDEDDALRRRQAFDGCAEIGLHEVGE